MDDVPIGELMKFYYRKSEIKILKLEEPEYRIVFSAADICKILGIVKSNLLFESLNAINTMLFHGVYAEEGINLVNEKGLNEIIDKSKSKEIDRFKKWVSELIQNLD